MGLRPNFPNLLVVQNRQSVAGWLAGVVPDRLGYQFLSTFPADALNELLHVGMGFGVVGECRVVGEELSDLVVKIIVFFAGLVGLVGRYGWLVGWGIACGIAWCMLGHFTITLVPPCICSVFCPFRERF